jgi:NitT/TauT family transport system substrate-binding protein
LRISYAAIAANIAGIWMAEGSGAFKKHGLDVQLVYIPSSGTNVQALLGGSIDVMIAGSSGIVSAAARGAPLVAIGSQMNRPPVTLYVQPDIRTPDQLRNQVLSITRFGSSTHALSTLVLRKPGLEKTVTLRPLGETPAVQAAFEQKMIAGMHDGEAANSRAAPRQRSRLGHPILDEHHRCDPVLKALVRVN